MKKLILLLFLLCNINIGFANDIYWFKATEFSIKMKHNGYWQDWTDWQDCDIEVKFDFNNEKITIYSNEVQIYRIISHIKQDSDGSGGTADTFKVKDQDGRRGQLRLRQQSDGERQIYIDFNDVSWVYNIHLQ